MTATTNDAPLAATAASQAPTSNPAAKEEPRRNDHGYFREHLVGGQSLAWSFWVNLVIIPHLFGLIVWGTRYASFEAFEAGSGMTGLTLLLFAMGGLAFLVVVALWAVIGVVFSAQDYLRDGGSRTTTRLLFTAMIFIVATWITLLAIKIWF